MKKAHISSEIIILTVPGLPPPTPLSHTHTGAPPFFLLHLVSRAVLLPPHPPFYPLNPFPACPHLPREPSTETMLWLLISSGTLTAHLHGCSDWSSGSKHTQENYIIIQIFSTSKFTFLK